MPLRAQLDTIWATSDRAAGSGLLFVRGRVVGARDNALLIETADGVLAGFAPSDHEALAYRDNLRLLGSVANLEILAIGKVQFDHPASVSLLAVSPTAAPLPDDWLGRVNLGLDVLTRAHLPNAGKVSAAAPLAVPT